MRGVHHPDLDLLRRIDSYFDQVPRSAARAELLGPLTLFVRVGPGWPYYARPTPGAAPVGPAHVEQVRARQRELTLPEAFEWVVELAPEMGPAAAATGLELTLHPLMHLGEFRPAGPTPGFSVRLVDPRDDLRLVLAVPAVAFAHPGAQVGREGGAALVEAGRAQEARLAVAEDRMARGLTVSAAAFQGAMPVAVGSHQPVGDATEIVGVGVLPAFRRRGLGAAVTAALVEDAVDRGMDMIVLSAGDAATASVYRRLGFDTVGTAGAAEPPSSPG